MATKKPMVIEMIEAPVVTKPTQYQGVIQAVPGAHIIMNRIFEPGEIEAIVGGGKSKIGPTEREEATWKEKAYWDEEGNAFIPSENFHESMKDGAKYWGQKIPGEGNKTYTDVVASAVVVPTKLTVISGGAPVTRQTDTLLRFAKYCNGTPGKGKKSGTRVYKVRPMIGGWSASFVLLAYDRRLTKDVLRTVISYAGTFKGLGDWRPTYGRYELISLEEV